MDYRYGLQARPFSADPQLANANWKTIVTSDKIDEALKGQLGNAVRHGIMITSTKLDDEFIAKHELVDIKAFLNSGYNKVKKVIQYLVDKNKRHLFMTKGFFSQIEMSEDEFITLCCDYGFESEDELYESVELAYLQSKKVS
jgi:hypothetical protein